MMKKNGDTPQRSQILPTAGTVRWGIIGCGAVTESKSGPAYQQTPGFSLEAVMRRDIHKAEDYARRHGVEYFTDKAENLIESPLVDAVYIATPPDSHKHYALLVAQASKPCCVEKPLAPSYGDCLEITSAFAEANKPLFVAYYRRSLQRFHQIKTWLEGGRLGKIQNLRWEYSRVPSEIDLSGAYQWRTDEKIAPGGYFDDLASHGINLFEWLLGEIAEATGLGENRRGMYSALDYVKGSWTHLGGIRGEGLWNFSAEKHRDEVVIQGEKGQVTFAIFGDGPLLLESGGDRREKSVKNPDPIQLPHVRNLQAHLSGKIVHPSNGNSAAHTAWVMDRILGKD